MIAEYFTKTLHTEDTSVFEGKVQFDNKIGYLSTSKSLAPLHIEAQSLFSENNITIIATGKSLFDKSVRQPSILLNGNKIGEMFISGEHIKDGAMCKVFISDMEPISAYDIGIGDRFIFFRSNNTTVGCSYYRDTQGFTTFAENEWLLQLLMTITIYISNDRKDSGSYITSDSRTLDYYDSNYISNLICTEPLEIRNKYEFLIHKQYNNPERVNNLKKRNASSIFKIIIFMAIFFLGIIGVLFAISTSHFNELKENTYHATNQTSGHHISFGTFGASKYGLDVVYEDKNGITHSETIMVSRSEYSKYKDIDEFDFSVRSWYDSEDHKTRYEYKIGELNLFNYLLTETDGLFLVILFGIFFEGLLIFAYIKSKRGIRKKTNQNIS